MFYRALCCTLECEHARIDNGFREGTTESKAGGEKRNRGDIIDWERDMREVRANSGARAAAVTFNERQLRQL